MNTARQTNDMTDIRSAVKHVTVMVVKFHSFSDVKTIASYISAGTPVLINIKGMDSSLFERMRDYLTGYTDCCNGKVAKLSNQTLLVAPYNVELSGDAFLNLYGDQEFDPDLGDMWSTSNN